MEYEVVKEKGGQYYITKDGKAVPGSYGDKKKVIKQAARLNGMTTKEFLKERKVN